MTLGPPALYNAPCDTDALNSIVVLAPLRKSLGGGPSNNGYSTV